MSHRYERGQVIPIWIGAILTSFLLMFFGLNYANALRWQIRAQNAADAAAQGLLAIQTERWNLMMQTLYATNVEEYRMRHLLDGILLAVTDSGGCSFDTYNYSIGEEPTVNGTCPVVYKTLVAQYIKATARYTTDVQLLNDVTFPATNKNWESDVQSLLAHMQSTADCNQVGVTSAQYNADPSGGDCAFVYKEAGIAYRTGLLAVENDAYGDLIPGLGRVAMANGADTENTALFQPGEIDITTCAIVPPIIPSFGPFKAQTFYAVGRAAAQATQVEQDWLEPGSVFDPVRGNGSNTMFQPEEIYDGYGAVPANHWYDVDFDGNAATAYQYPGYPPFFSEPFYANEMSARLGWWNAIPMLPFAKGVTVATACAGAQG